MQLPKAIRVGNVDEAKLCVEVYNRPMLFVVKAVDGDEFWRVHPSGKIEDLTDKVRRAYALVSGSLPMVQGDLLDEKNANVSKRK